MAHLNDKLADFFYEELPATEMVEARRHVADCGECRAQVQLFERTHLALKNLPDAEPPRSVIFAQPERTAPGRVLDWRFLAPMAAAFAALVIAIMPASSPAQLLRLLPLRRPYPRLLSRRPRPCDRLRPHCRPGSTVRARMVSGSIGETRQGNPAA